MKKEKMMAVFIGFIMISSMVGFAMMSYVPTKTNTVEISPIVQGPLKTENVVYILQTGRVLIRYWYNETCADCSDKLAALENFTIENSKYVVLEKVEIPSDDNTTSEKLEMIGKDGEIKEIESVSKHSLMNIFCDIAMLQPKECLLKEI